MNLAIALFIVSIFLQVFGWFDLINGNLEYAFFKFLISLFFGVLCVLANKRKWG